MVDLAEIQTAYYMAAATGVIVAAIYYIINLRYSTKAREIEICRYFSSEWTSSEALSRWAIFMTMEWKDDEEFMEKYGYSNPEMFGIWVSYFFTYQTAGILLKSKVVGDDKLYALGGYGAIKAWEKYKDIIQSRRGVAWGEDYMSDFESFAQEMLKIKMRNDASFRDKLETYRRTKKP